MPRYLWLASTLLTSICISLACSISCAIAKNPPNIVLVLADDLGWSDLGCYGADYHETPHLDELARKGIRYTQAYAPAPVCSPTRAAILTGKAPARLGITIWSEGSLASPTGKKMVQGKSRHDLPLEEVTMAERLQKSGYLTALIGKWHLGDGGHAPETQGFDVNIGGTHWGAPPTYFFPYRGSQRFQGEFRYVPHLEFGWPDEYLTDRLTTEAMRVIDRAASLHQPFFLMLAHHAPHTPMEAKANDVAYFEGKQRPEFKHQHPVYAAMIRSLDASVGLLRERLKQRQLDGNTVFIFTSDNGGYIGTSAVAGKEIAITNNSPLRSGKGTCYEGGLRVPLLISWPDAIKSSSIVGEPVILTDLFSTILSITGLTAKEDPTDGLDISPTFASHVSGGNKLARQELFWHYPHYYHAPASTPCGAIRFRDWKLIEYFEDDHVELYNLAEDSSESRDLAKQNADLASNLRSRLQQWRTAVGASMPTPTTNPQPASAPPPP